MAALVETEAIETLGGLEAIRPEWDRLLRACPSATPFQHPEWLMAWWRHLGQGRPLALAMRVAGRLVGLAPLCRLGSTISLAGAGVSDYLGLIADPSAGLIAAAAFYERLAGLPGWTECRLDGLGPSSELLSVKPPGRLRAGRAAAEVCLRVDLSAWKGGRNRRRVHRGAIEARLTVEAADSEGKAAGFLDLLFRLHARRWARAGSGGVLQGERMRRFHEEAAQGFFRKGMLRLYRMTFEGRDAAALYAFERSGRLFAYLSGFDPELARLSPGRRLLEAVALDCLGRGVRELDFMRGAERYKYDWGPVESRNTTLVITGAAGPHAACAIE